MAAHDYHFLTRWRVEGKPEEAYDVIADAESLARWWPSVYLEVTPVAPPDSSGVGRVMDLHTKGFLPYTQRSRSCAGSPSCSSPSSPPTTAGR